MSTGSENVCLDEEVEDSSGSCAPRDSVRERRLGVSRFRNLNRASGFLPVAVHGAGAIIEEEEDLAAKDKVV